MDVNIEYDNLTNKVDFRLGNLSTYILSDITDNISFLNENTIRMQSDGSFKFVVERVYIKFTVENYLGISIGKFHTPVSYWNIVYHHGRVLQPTTTPPFIIQDGIITRHTTGLMINGDFIGKKNFAYRLLIGNGIGSSSIFDNDSTKSITMNVQFNPMEDITFFVAAYFDRISSNVPNLNGVLLTENIDQKLFSTGLIYNPKRSKIMLLSEFYIIKNKIQILIKLN